MDSECIEEGGNDLPLLKNMNNENILWCDKKEVFLVYYLARVRMLINAN